MTQRVERNYLEITSVKDLKETNLPSLNCSITLLEPENFQINKFFYKIVGKKHNWTDRLSWSESQWIQYSSDEKSDNFLRIEYDLIAAGRNEKVPLFTTYAYKMDSMVTLRYKKVRRENLIYKQKKSSTVLVKGS